jgi:hypothetical protein
MNVNLVNVSGYLCVAQTDIPQRYRDEFQIDHDHTLVTVYPEGDCDAARWPLGTDLRILARAVFDAHETGLLPDGVDTLTLPDGTVLDICDLMRDHLC